MMTSSSKSSSVWLAGIVSGVLCVPNVRGQAEVPRFYTATSNDALTGAAPLVKTGAGVLWLTSPSNNTFTGDITVGVDGGTLRIGGNTFYGAGTGRTGTTLPAMGAASTITVKRGGIFQINDNLNGAAGRIDNRLGSEGNRPAVSLEGGTFYFYGINATQQTTQSVGQVTLASGTSVINVNRTHATSTPKLIGAGLAVTPGAYASFVGTTPGAAAANVSQFYFTTPPSTVGGGGAFGSPTVSIVPATRIGNDFVAYGLYGIRALLATEYKATSDINTAGDTENVKFTTGTLSALAGNKTVNSLAILGGTSPWNMGTGNTLTLTSGQLLSTPNLTIAQGAVTAGAGSDTDLDIVPTGNTLTMSANLVDNGSGKVKLVKSGGGTLTLSPASDNTYSGGTVVNEGTLRTSGTTDNRRFFGTGPVKVDNATLSLSAVGSTANSAGDDYTAVNAAQINVANLAYTAADTFNIESGSVIAGSSSTANQGLNSLSRGSNVTLADGAVIGQGTALTAPLNLGTGTIKDLGTGADLYYGLYGNQNNVSGSVTVGSGTPFKGISTDRSARSWQQGTIDVAAGTTGFALQGLPIPGTAPYTLTLGNDLTAGAPVINLNGSGTVDAHLYGYVTLSDDQSVFGDTTAGEVVNFTVEPGAQLTANRQDCMGSGTGLATATVKAGGTMAIGTSVVNTPWAALNGDVTVEAGGRFVANNALGISGAGALTFKPGSILDIQAGDGFSGPQAAAATVEPGTIVRLYASAGSASDPLDNYLGDNSPVYEVYAANRSAVNPLALGTTVMTLNRGANGAGGMLINDNASRTYGSVPNGMIAIGTNGGVIAATRYTTLTVSQPIALDTNELVIGSTETFDWVSEPKLGTVLLSASMGASTAGKGSRITVLPDVELRNGAHSLPDLAEVDVGGVFYLAGADTIGALSGTGLVTVASTLTVGCNDADATFSGVLTGASGLYKTGAGRLDLTGDQSTFTGTVRVNGGELALSGNGRLNNTGTAAYTLAENGVLHLDNSENNLTNRLTGAAPRVTFNGGTFRLTGQDGAAAGETVENAVFASGDSTIEIINGTGAGSSTELIFASFTGNPAGTVNFIGSNGTLGEPGDNPRVKFNGLAAGLVACGRVGEHLAIYDTVNGIKAFTLPEGTEFDGTVSQSGINTVFTSANVSPTMTAARSVNSLWISNPGSGKSLSLGTFNLTVTSGRILLAGTDDFSITRAGSGILTCTPTYLFLGVDDKDTTLTLGVPTDKAIAKEGAGTLIIDSVCTFTGGLVINDGTVTYGAGGDLAATSLQTWNDGLLDLAGKSDTLGALTLYAGGITNSDESVESTLAIGALTMGSGPVGSSAFVDVGTNGTLKLGGTVTYNVVNDPNTAYIRGKALDLNVAAGSSRTFTVNDSVAPSAYIDLDISAAIGGVANAGITKGGTGTLRLSGANTFDGPLNITGTLRLAHPQAHGLPSTTRAMTINNGYSLVLDNANGNIDVPSNYTLNFRGTGYAGIGPVSGAIVNWSGDNSLSGAATLANTATLASLAGTLTLSGDISGNYALTVQGDGDVVLAGARGSTTTGATLIKYGAGTLTLTGASSFTGATTLYAGVMNVRNNTALGTAAGGVTTYIGSELQLENDITIGAEALTLRGTGLSNGGALRNLSGTNTYGGKVTLGMTDVRINSDVGRLILDMASGNAVEGNTFNVLFGGEGDIEVADPIATGTGMLTKDGGGTLILGGVNTYTGATTVDDGALRVNGSIHATSPVTVQDGGALEGTGTCLGTVTARSGATVAPGVPGTAGGTLTIATLNLEAGSVCAFECKAAPANDQLVVSGSGKLTIAAGTGVALHAAGTTNAWAVLGTYNLIQYVGTLNGGVENLVVVNPDSDVLYTFFTEDNWIKVKVESAKVSALAATELTTSGGKLNGQVVDVAAEAPSVWFCWDTGDKGTAATSAWANVEYVGVYAKGQSFSKLLTGLLSASNYTYRVYAENSVGPAWSPEAISFKPVYLPSISSTGARVTGPGAVLLQGVVLDIGSEAPRVWFRYWQAGGATTNELDAGTQTGACSVEATGLPLGIAYAYLMVASNQAGVVVSETEAFTTAVIHHVSDAIGNDSNDGASWPTALKTIAAAIAQASDGDTILVTNGIYSITAQLTLDKALTLVSVNGREATGIRGNNSFRLLYIDNPYALVSGFTLSQGRITTGAPGGGFAIGALGGSVEECRVTTCNSSVWSMTGTAVHQVAGRVSRCLIDNNSFNYGCSGTVYLSGGLIENCVIANNRMHRDGGGLYLAGGVARNCTVVGNESTGNGAGVYRSGAGRLENCIVWNNVLRTDPTQVARNLYGATPETVVNCCTPEAVGSGTVTQTPLFLDEANDDYRLQASSPCIDAGETMLCTEDIDCGGGARVIGAAVDIGAFEFDTARLACGFRATPAAGLAPLQTTLVPTVFGTSTDTNLLELVWRIDRGLEEPLVVSNTGLQSLTRTLDAGWYTVTLEVTDPLVPATAAAVVTNAIGVSPETLYVVTENTNACTPFATWETAATNLHDAMALAWDGALIQVSNGTYRIARQLLFDRGVIMRSVGGYAATTIQAPTVGGVRVALLCHADARLEGFTLRDGRGSTGNPGGGVLMSAAGGTLFNCRVTANACGSYDGHGGGVRLNGGRVSNCVIDNNRLTLDSMQGVGVYQSGGILENCLIVTNKTYSLTQNNGGGVNLNGSGIVRNCTIVGNTAAYGGGITRNSGTIQNCIIVDNVTGADTGPGAPNWYNAHATAYQNVCTPVEVGTGCVTADPDFVDLEAHNYQLRLGSPCIDAGLSLDGLPDDDLAGNPRVTGTGLDIGAYEYDARVLSCGISATPAKAVTAADVQLSASFFGFDSETNDLHFAWVLDDAAGTPVQSGMGLAVVQQTYDTLGRYHVRLTVSEPSSGKSVSTVLTNAVHIAPATLYLVQSNSVPVAPYDTWAKAGTNIHEVLGEAAGGSTVLISNGTYDVSQTITLDEDIVLRGVNGWSQTTLKGRKVDGVRIFDINHAAAMVEGLTIRGGKTAYIGFGGGVNIAEGTLRRCLVTDNAVGGYSTGAGVNQIGGLVSGCIISNNAWSESAGGLSINGGVCENTLITASRAAYGGGVRINGGLLRNCTITGNTGTGTDSDGNTRGGGGLWRAGGTIVNCIIWGNTANNPATPGYPDWSGSSDTAYKHTCTSVAVGENCVVADPRFKDAARRDYRLTSHSPCRDKGLYQEWMAGASDLWGNPRVDVKQHVDIGAHEEQSSLSTMMILR